jgi:hypothetical protein
MIKLNLSKDAGKSDSQAEIDDIPNSKKGKTRANDK